MVIQLAAGEICTRALRLAGYIGAKATPKSEDLEIAFQELQGLIDIWHSEKLMDLYDESLSHTVPGNTSSFTIGPLGDLVTDDVPVSINTLRIMNGDCESVLKQYNVVDIERLGYIQNESGYPAYFTYQAKSDLGTITLYPKASSSLSLSVGVGNRIPVPADEDAVMTLRNGWYQTILYCLADNIQIPLNIPQGEISSTLAQKAKSFKDRLKATRLRVAAPGKVDSALLRGRFSSSRRGY